MSRLQSVLRAASPLVLGLPGCGPVWTAMHETLFWLIYPHWVTYKLCFLAHKFGQPSFGTSGPVASSDMPMSLRNSNFSDSRHLLKTVHFLSYSIMAPLWQFFYINFAFGISVYYYVLIFPSSVAKISNAKTRSWKHKLEWLDVWLFVCKNKLVCEYRIEMMYGDLESLKEVRCVVQVAQSIYWYMATVKSWTKQW